MSIQSSHTVFLATLSVCGGLTEWSGAQAEVRVAPIVARTPTLGDSEGLPDCDGNGVPDSDVCLTAPPMDQWCSEPDGSFHCEGDTSCLDLSGKTSCGVSNRPDGWWRFVAPVSGQANLRTCTEPFSGDSFFAKTLSVFDNCGGIELTCSNESTEQFPDGGCGICAPDEVHVTLDVHEGQTYWVRIGGRSNPESGPYDLTVSFTEGVPRIVRSPMSQQRCVGAPAFFGVTAHAVPIASYRWFKGGNAIPGGSAALATYVIDSVQSTDAGIYSCRVTNAVGDVFSQSATLTVLDECLEPVFAPCATIPVGAGPLSVAGAQFDDDGKADLAVVNNLDDSLSVILGAEDCTSLASLQVPLSAGDQPVAIATGLTSGGDLVLDLAVATQNGIQTFINDGAGGFTFAALPLDDSDTVRADLLFSDVNGGGEEDLLALSAVSPGEPAQLLNGRMGDGGHSGLNDIGNPADEQSTTPPFALATESQRIAAGNVSGDSLPELMVLHTGENRFAVYSNQGQSSSEDTPDCREIINCCPCQQWQGFGSDCCSVYDDCFGAAGCSDSLCEQAVCNVRASCCSNSGWSESCATLGRQLCADLCGGRSVNVGADTEPWDLVVTQLDGARLADVATANRASGTVTIFLNTGTPLIFPSAPSQTIAVGAAPVAIAACDLDGDGRPDLVTANRDGNTLSVLLNTGGGVFKQSGEVDLGDGCTPVDVEPADVNGDGRIDLVVTCFSANTLVVMLNTVGVVLGDGDSDGDVDLNDFGIYVDCALGPDQPVVSDCQTFDFDGDQDVDLVDFGDLQRILGGPMP